MYLTSSIISTIMLNMVFNPNSLLNLNRKGKPKGSKRKKTINMELAQEQLQQAVFANLKPLTAAAIQSAIGEVYVYRVFDDNCDEKKHSLVEDPKEIEKALDEISRGNFEKNYYYISTKPSNTNALKELFDRGFGKSKEIKDVNINVSLHDVAQRALERRANAEYRLEPPHEYHER